MLVYWCLLLFFVIGTLASRTGVQSRGSFYGLILGGVVLVIVVGLRDQVGGDWGAYQKMFRHAELIDFTGMLALGDPAYQFLNWVVQRLEWPFWVINLSCASIFIWGLVRFSFAQRNPWLAMLVAVPYLVIVVAMGYTRQAVAIGIILLGLAAMHRGTSVLKFGIYVLVAALFHKTAVVAILLVALTGERNKFINIMIVAAGAVLLYDSLLRNSMDNLMLNYVDAKYSSQGAYIRIALCIVPAAMFLAFRRRLGFAPHEMSLWRNASFAAFIALFALMITPSSTAVDRISLYLLPLQLAMMAQLPRILSSENLAKFALIAYAIAIQFTWLNYATNAYYWLPYHSYLT